MVPSKIKLDGHWQTAGRAMSEMWTKVYLWTDSVRRVLIMWLTCHGLLKISHFKPVSHLWRCSHVNHDWEGHCKGSCYCLCFLFSLREIRQFFVKPQENPYHIDYNIPYVSMKPLFSVAVIHLEYTDKEALWLVPKATMDTCDRNLKWLTVLLRKIKN